MSRSTSNMGLNSRARTFIDENVLKILSKCDCPDCKTQHIIKMACEVYDLETGVKMGMFDDGPVLSKYRFNNGKIAYEIVQDCVWSSGPNIFLCLSYSKNKKDMIKETMWSASEIGNISGDYGIEEGYKQ